MRARYACFAGYYINSDFSAREAMLCLFLVLCFTPMIKAAPTMIQLHAMIKVVPSPLQRVNSSVSAPFIMTTLSFTGGKLSHSTTTIQKKGWMIEIDLLQWLGEDQKITLACTFYWFSTSYLWGHRCWRGHRGTRVVFQPFPVMITMSFINTCARIECHIKAIVVSIAPSNHTKLPVIHAPEKPIVLSANFVKIGSFAII